MNAFGRLVVGLLLVVFDVDLRSQQVQFDLLPDVLGWLLAASAATRLARLHGAFAVARVVAILGTIWSVFVLVVFVGHTPTAFVAGLVDIVLLTAVSFCVCTGLVATSSDPRTVRSADVLRWVDLATTVVGVPLAAVAAVLHPGRVPLGLDAPGLTPFILAVVVVGVAVRVGFIGLLLTTPVRRVATTVEGRPVRSTTWET